MEVPGHNQEEMAKKMGEGGSGDQDCSSQWSGVLGNAEHLGCTAVFWVLGIPGTYELV